ncbi:cyclic nucleotide-binding domain-containing protein [bacterium]|nr:cyclic nucleotide-binding domain-containing protein [bacterium]
MDIHDEVKCLRGIPLFANMEPAKLKLLAFASERLTFQDGEILCEQGEPGLNAFIILKGEAEILIHADRDCGAPAPLLPVAVLGASEIVGEIAILCDKPRTATVRAKGELITLSISKDLFYRMVMEFPQIAIEIMRVLALRLERTTARLREAAHPCGPAA